MSTLKQLQVYYQALHEVEESIHGLLHTNKLAIAHAVQYTNRTGLFVNLSETEGGRQIASDLDVYVLESRLESAVRILKEVKRLMETQKEEGNIAILDSPEMQELYRELSRTRKEFLECADKVDAMITKTLGPFPSDND